MTLFEITQGHWLLLVADLHERCFFMYDSLWSPADKNRQELMESTISLVLVFLRSTTYADATQTIVHDIFEPGLVMYMLSYLFHSGHDYGVFVMSCMELLSLKANGFHFDQDYIAHYRDKCLLSFLYGRVAHFPEHLTGWSTTCPTLSPLQPGLHNSLLVACELHACLCRRPCQMTHSK
ncbi:hypothetical protein Cgig2_013609 [Carnegiea gigantea]|uniref:Ubiquitin-like protease family profile domain-containing protein n=1 Tax=Carnegiea gigantea TaxID=171969 RepID=A0A9Q1KBJ4_9CARY|nr:hypothetical protein Cgig2_013609 [Carnegiea gigantea]